MMKITAFILLLTASSYALPFENFVVGGENAIVGEFPYVVSLRISNSHSCGGSIVDSMHVLTAAHCVAGRNPSTLSVQYGSLVLDPQSPKVANVASVAIHESYTTSGIPLYPNDVAILTLASQLPYSSAVQPVKMPIANSPTPGNSKAILIGWGYNATGGQLMKTLQKVAITLYTDANCAAAHGTNVNSMYHVCAGVPEGGKGQCSGDSGGPLTVNGIQRGSVSWSVKPCTVQGFPGVFANTARYVTWICNRAKCTFG